MPTTPSAVLTVLHTPELLELILLALATPSTVPGTRTLLTSIPRVCHTFRAVLCSSLALRRALFFAPVADRGALRALNPPGQVPANSCTADALPRALVPAPNEFAVRRFRLGRFDEPDADYDGGYMPMVALRWIDESAAAEKEEAGAGGDGEPSWRRMLVAQPPPRRVEVVVYGTIMFQNVKAWVECEDGVTLGMLHDRCRELACGRGWQKRSMGWYFEL
ncbi:hypothetical protein MPH_07779 [Macrophomina phaseolina MS6]|uniref:F-box domain-containing protein n=1 Tax=Macrophomina phaseolina (strain MS6) TaxID=1126212 RepID=K2QYS5_MACPH|nr:hypothetical protein MPH_07779 [Macrophomina phaseolina MS6]